MNARTAAIGAGLTLALAVAVMIAPAPADDPSDVDTFAEELARRHGFEPDQVASVLAGARVRDDILEAIARPAESKPWFEYRPIFLTPSRIGGGVEFWAEHEKLLERASEEFGVEPEIIVAIIGVETRYGQITGSYRVLDALTTLAFHYPPRASFFRGELEEFFLLSREEGLSLDEVQGSYAGAMGYGQFIPSSYRAYAVDFDGDGDRELWHHADAIGSVANYFKVHGWQRGEPVAVKAEAAPSARPLESRSLKPDHSVADLARRGFEPQADVDAGEPATLIALEQPDGPEYWLGFNNFYVISRYNRSALYSMAVHQLSQAIADARDYEMEQQAP